jgi:hypothetical protein
VQDPLPYPFGAWPVPWIGVLRELEALPVAALVPGHGPVMRDRAYVAEVREVMESIMAQARAAWRPGMSAAELRGKIDLEAHRKRIAGDDAIIGANFDYMIKDLAVGRAWQELAGQWQPEGL